MMPLHTILSCRYLSTFHILLVGHTFLMSKSCVTWYYIPSLPHLEPGIYICPERTFDEYLLNLLSFPSFATKYCYHHLRTYLSWRQYIYVMTATFLCTIISPWGSREACLYHPHSMLGETGGPGGHSQPDDCLELNDGRQLLMSKGKENILPPLLIVKAPKILHLCQKNV